MRFFLLFAFVFQGVFQVAFQMAPASGFKPPQSEAERALDAIILNSAQGDVYAFLTDISGNFDDSAPYYAMFTRGYVAKIRAVESGLCSPEYRSKPMEYKCTIDVNPVTCSPDEPLFASDAGSYGLESLYLYKTYKHGRGYAYITQIPASHPSVAPRDFKMVKEGGVWKLEASPCTLGYPT